MKTEEFYPWAAGLLEGEGCFSIFHRKTAKWDHKCLAIHCEMTDEDTIVKLCDGFGCGTINQRLAKKRNDNRARKDTWIWSVQNHLDIRYVLENIREFMGIRRSAKITEMLEYMDEG